MAELHKRGSLLDSNGQLSQSAKRLGEQQAVVPTNCVVKQEPEEPEERDVSPVVRAAGAVAAAAAEAMVMVEEPQIKLRFGLSLFHCRACVLPLRPPTFKCQAGHVVCGACSSIQAHACAAALAAAFVACPDVDVYVRGARLPCPNKKFGCEACSVYYQAGDRARVPVAPCRCPDPGCDADTSDSPARLAAHFAARHAWPVTDVSYAKAHRIALPRLPRGLHVLVAKEDESVFLVSSSALGPGAAAVSLVCVRANGGAAAGAPQFRCTLWVEDAHGGGNVARVTFAVAGRVLSTGGFTAVEHNPLIESCT